MIMGMLFVVWLLMPILMKWYYKIGLTFVEKSTQLEITEKSFQNLLEYAGLGLLKVMGIPFLVFMVLGVVANVSQTGGIYEPKKLEPKWDKLNIFSALTKFIYMKKVVDAIKGHSKSIVITVKYSMVVKP